MTRASLALFALLACGASAQPTHLVPEVGEFARRTDYQSLLSETFIPSGYRDDVTARMLFLPSFGREWLVEVREASEGYMALSVQPDSSIWYSGYTGDGRWSVESARRSVFERDSLALETGTAELIAEVWNRAILNTRYPEEVVWMLDGVVVHFSQWDLDGRGMISGQTHSPPQGSIADGLIDLGVMVGEYAQGMPITQSAIRERARELLSQIATSQ